MPIAMWTVVEQSHPTSSLRGCSGLTGASLVYLRGGHEPLLSWTALAGPLGLTRSGEPMARRCAAFACGPRAPSRWIQNVGKRASRQSGSPRPRRSRRSHRRLPHRACDAGGWRGCRACAHPDRYGGSKSARSSSRLEQTVVGLRARCTSNSYSRRHNSTFTPAKVTTCAAVSTVSEPTERIGASPASSTRRSSARKRARNSR